MEHVEEMIKTTHKPNIDNRSRKIIKDLHEKLSENQIPHYASALTLYSRSDSAIGATPSPSNYRSPQHNLAAGPPKNGAQ